MASPTRTIAPLHLEDLEPHRFEDLIRQLLYDFRPWRQLEATDRSGTDQGFDARGWEIVPAEEGAALSSDEEELPEPVSARAKLPWAHAGEINIPTSPMPSAEMLARTRRLGEPSSPPVSAKAGPILRTWSLR